MNMSSNNTNSSALSNDDYLYYLASTVYSFFIYFFLPLLILITLIAIYVGCRQCYLACTRRRQSASASASASIQVVVRRDISSLPTARTYAETSACAICLVEYKDDGDVERVLTRCGHVFHRSCLHQWVMTDHATCPICRASTVAPPVASAVN